MPPKGVVVASPSPPPMPPNDVQDLLVIADMVDTLDHVPAEVTRVHSDLNELSAVLYCKLSQNFRGRKLTYSATLVTLENKLNTLVTWIQDDSVSPADRFQLLQEIAEEAARYKLGGDDKIRVSAGACDGVSLPVSTFIVLPADQQLMHHQKHISNLLQSSTLLASAPPSPYTQALTLANPQPLTNTRRGVLARAANSPFGGRGYAAASGSGETVKDKDTPSKKKKSRVAQLGVKDDDEVSIGGKKPTKKRKP
jgi:inhibitor of growth protein 3